MVFYYKSYILTFRWTTSTSSVMHFTLLTQNIIVLIMTIQLDLLIDLFECLNVNYKLCVLHYKSYPEMLLN